MDLQKILRSLENCPCGKKHTFATRMVEIESGLTQRVGEILTRADFPKKVLIVSDEAAMRAADGVLESLTAAGFELKKLIYRDMRYARVEQVREVEAALDDVDGVVAVGTGSVDDLCRVSSFEKKQRFCIFATAPSMDGFASDTAPIIENNFKTSWYVEQPEIILADTKILAAAPVELKAAGFGDMVAKYIGVLEWRIAHLLTDEYYCPAVADLTMQGVQKVISMADRVQTCDEAAAGSIMEGLILSGLGMKLAGCSRPASGAEHVLSHYWECYKLARGIWPEFHGKKVGVTTVLINRIYHNIADRVETIDPVPDPTDLEQVKANFDPSQVPDVIKLNVPAVTEGFDLSRFKASWPEIRRLIQTTLPTNEQLLGYMKTAGAVTEPAEVHVGPELVARGLRYHAYMRHRIYLTRLLPMIGLDPVDFIE